MEAETEIKTIQDAKSCNKTEMEKTETAIQSAIFIPLDCLFLDAWKTAHRARQINK